MKLAKKLEYAKQSVTSIATHDDAPVKERAAVLRELKNHIDKELDEASLRGKKTADNKTDDKQE